MKIITKYVLCVFVLLNLFFVSADNNIYAYLFYGQGCPHCAGMLEFLDDMSDKYPTMKLNVFEVYNQPENAVLFQQYAAALGKSISGVPTLFMNHKMFVGYSTGIANDIEEEILYCLTHNCHQTVLPEEEPEPNIEETAEDIIATKEMTERVLDIMVDDLESGEAEEDVGDTTESTGTINQSDAQAQPSQNGEQAIIKLDDKVMTEEEKLQLEEYQWLTKQGRYDVFGWIFVIIVFGVGMFYIVKTLKKKHKR